MNNSNHAFFNLVMETKQRGSCRLSIPSSKMSYRTSKIKHLTTVSGCLSLQVLQNDVLAHEATVETVNKAGSDLVESSAGEEASSLQSKLENLNQRWKAILEKTAQRKHQLKAALLQV